MDAIEELSQLSDSMRQAAALLADEEVDDTPSSVSSKRASTFLNVVTLGNTVSTAYQSLFTSSIPFFLFLGMGVLLYWILMEYLKPDLYNRSRVILDLNF